MVDMAEKLDDETSVKVSWAHENTGGARLHLNQIIILMTNDDPSEPTDIMLRRGLMIFSSSKSFVSWLVYEIAPHCSQEEEEEKIFFLGSSPHYLVSHIPTDQ